MEDVPEPRVDWGIDDIDAISKGIVEDLLEMPEVSALAGTARGDDLRVPAYMAGIANETNVPIASEALLAAVERQLVGSGRFRFVTEAESDDPAPKGPRRVPKVTADRAREAGSELEAEFSIYAVFKALKGGNEASGAPGYVLVLHCIDTHDDELMWSTEREITRSAADFFRAP